jgi:DNA mismatch repair protein MutS2
MVERLADATTEAVLGCAALLAALDPDSPAAREAARAPRLYTTADHADWSAEIAACQDAERWIEASSGAHADARDALSQLPTLDVPARRLRADEALAEGELFTLKRFLYFAHLLASAAHPLLCAWDEAAASWPEQIAQLMHQLHPEPAPSPRFHLSSDLDPALVALRRQLQDARRAARELRQAGEAAVRADYGVAFDFEGLLRLTPAHGARASQDRRLRARRDAWELADATADTAQAEVQRLDDACRDVEQALLLRLSDQLRHALPLLDALSSALVTLDLRLARARLRGRLDGCWPTWRVDASGAHMIGAVSPRIKARNPSAQAVDLEVAYAPVVITGPNMGGKSSALKLLGLCQWAMQHALPAPAAAFHAAPVCAIIYVGSDEPHADTAPSGLSSFGREVQRLVAAMAQDPTPRLWLLDEVGRGTHPDEGALMARRVVERLHALGDAVIAVTHFPALAAMPDAARWRVAGLDRDAVREALASADHADPAALAHALTGAMDYRLLRASSGDALVPRDATLVAELLGLCLD